ncbi:MAG: 50S ribosomal protein L10 [Candidatus Omnitrophica bacterium]|nr:50S ribosomal protein L10 [Candidatus Omnitrophota bacterium]
MEKFGRVCKEYVIGEISKRFEQYPDFFITTFSEIGVNDMDKFRKSLNKDSSSYMVVKNSMLKLAMEQSKNKIGINEIAPTMTGSCGVLFSKDDCAAMARSLVGFSKEYKGLKIHGGLLAGEKVTVDTIRHLASLPPREVLLAMAVSGIKAPISGFVGLLSNLMRNLLGVIEAIGKKKNQS